MKQKAVPLPQELAGSEMAGFLNLVEPQARQGRERLAEGIQALAERYGQFPFDRATAVDFLWPGLLADLLRIISRTLVLELHVARLQELLQGETPEERFQQFAERLRRPEVALALLAEYPVLARQAVITIDYWVAASLDFLEHLCADWPAIQAAFCPDEDPGLLTAVHGGAGDKHRNGRSVMIAEFGDGFKLVYKPRSLAVDVHFQELLAWLNRRGNHPPFRLLKILDGGDHGWVEFVGAFGCGTAGQVARFYHRQGAYLALLHMLSAADFHAENLIAAGEHPVLVDMEALFHPRLFEQAPNWDGRPDHALLASSVLAIGLLPDRAWSNAGHDGVDISGLGGAGGQLTPFAVPRWDGSGTDEMRLQRRRVQLEGNQNRPALNGRDVDVRDYQESLLAGFTAMYRLLWQHRAELLAANGPLARFASDEVRVILRPTQTYAVLLSESFHPDVLRDALDRDRHFDRLWASADGRPDLDPLIVAEQADLHHGDIPVFYTRPGTAHLWTAAGKRIDSFLPQSGLALVEKQLRRFGGDDLERQRWIIRASLATLDAKQEPARQDKRQISAFGSPAAPERLLLAARALGDRLDELALRGREGEVAWLGLTMTGRGNWTLQPLGLDLYDGLPGLALFLAYLGALTAEARYTALAQAALKTVLHRLERDQDAAQDIGGFSGRGGLIYALTQLSLLWEQPELLARATALAAGLPALVEDDKALDIIHGAAGCIAALLTLYQYAPGEMVLAAAVQCGDHLLDRARPMARGIGWAADGEEPLTGFSHGAAGIAWALLKLAAASGEERFQRTAVEAIAYERSLFSQESGNWPDLRPVAGHEDHEQDPFPCFWCHGAAGIGLGRLAALPHLDDARVRGEIEAALRATASGGFGHNHSLCHGDLGNLELFLQAGRTLDEPAWFEQAVRLAGGILDNAGEHGWSCGNPLGVESPGLMTGLAGIGYGLLRLAAPDQVPAILLLAPPDLPTLLPTVTR